MQKGIKEKDIRDFEKCALKLLDIIERIRTYQPEANIYVAGNEMHLMSESDCGLSKEEAQELVVASVLITAMDCGDW